MQRRRQGQSFACPQSGKSEWVHWARLWFWRAPRRCGVDPDQAVLVAVHRTLPDNRR